MQLAGIKISNLFSFPYLSDIKSAQEVTFRNAGKSNVNVLIGPNGAGKSKFLNVIEYILKAGFMRDYVVDKAKLGSKDAHELQSVISENPVSLQKMYKHYSYLDQPSEVVVSFALTAHDYDNLSFLCGHLDEINTMINTYSTIAYSFSQMEMKDLLSTEHVMSLHITFDISHQTIEISREGLSPQALFILEYLIHIELIQICIDLHTTLALPSLWAPLRNTFAVIGLERSLEGISSQINPAVVDGFLFEKNHQEYAAYTGYYLCVKKIFSHLSPTTDTLDVEISRKSFRSLNFL